MRYQAALRPDMHNVNIPQRLTFQAPAVIRLQYKAKAAIPAAIYRARFLQMPSPPD
jgi:hypothetical protein